MPINGYGPVITVDWFALRRKADREPQHAAGTLPEMRHTYQRNSPRSKGKGGGAGGPRLDNSCALGYGQMDEEERKEP